MIEMLWPLADDAEGFSPAVMQSNNDFGIGATFSVNAHGEIIVFTPLENCLSETNVYNDFERTPLAKPLF